MHKPPENDVLQTGDLTINPRSGQVEIQGNIVRLGLVNMQVLLTLLENAGEMVSRADLFERVWKNQTVSDDTLTRCISELRAQLKEHSRYPKLIETLPKRGYRWVLAVDDASAGPATDSSPRLGFFQGHWKRISQVLLFALLSLSLFTMLVLWLLEISLRPEQARIVLVPIYSSQADQRALAADLDDILREQLLVTKNLRFFARSAVAGDRQSTFPYLSRDISAQWIIEGNIRKKEAGTRVSLSLVDAKTALVVYTLTKDLDKDSPQLEQFCSSFVEKVLRIVRPGDDH